MNNNEAVVFGAGKIARGFIGHLLTLSGYHITFVEKNPALVKALRKRGRYTVHILGALQKSITIEGFDVLGTDEVGKLIGAVGKAAVIFVSVGGQNLPQVAPLLAAALENRTHNINIILGENYFQPGQWLRSLIVERLNPAKHAWFAQSVGIVETLILRSSIEPSEEMRAKDPLSLQVQDMWELPADKEAFVGEIPPITGLAPKDQFQGSLIRKLFTYNSINAVIAYSGYLKGYKLLSEAANDPAILKLARESYEETSGALCKRYGFDPKEQHDFAEAAIAKYQKKEIVDPIERNARDPMRKLLRNDRLVGPACLALEYGTQPIALSQAIAAAFLYDVPEDPSSVTLQKIVRGFGISEALSKVSGIEKSSSLTEMIMRAYEALNAAQGAAAGSRR